MAALPHGMRSAARQIAGLAHRGAGSPVWARGVGADGAAGAPSTSGSFAAAAYGRVFAAGYAKAAPVKKVPRAAPDTGEDAGSDKKLAPLLKAMEPQVREVTRTPEELEEAKAKAKEYSRLKLAQENEQKKDLQMKIKMMWDAINALPAELQEAAKTPDYEPFPARRMPAFDTPPVPGYAGKSQEAADAAADKKGGLGKKQR